MWYNELTIIKGENTMRRKDREVTDPARIMEVIDRCSCCRIGFNDNGEVYIVPLNFGYEQNENTITFYFHSAKEGRKIQLIKTSPEVGFEMDTDYALHEADNACNYSAGFKSIIGNGIVSIVSEASEKRRGLSLLMEHSTGKKDWVFNDYMVNSVLVFRLTVTKLSCKEHK